MQFICVTYSLPVKIDNFTCFYAANTSHRMHATARKKTLKLRVTSLLGCRLTYLQFARGLNRGVIADCLQLRVFLPAIASFLACDCGYFCLRSGIFACKRKQCCMPVVSIFAWVPHVKLPVKYALIQINLPAAGGNSRVFCTRYLPHRHG